MYPRERGFFFCLATNLFLTASEINTGIVKFKFSVIRNLN